jgi:hypothetical protein
VSWSRYVAPSPLPLSHEWERGTIALSPKGESGREGLREKGVRIFCVVMNIFAMRKRESRARGGGSLRIEIFGIASINLLRPSD